VKTGPEKVMRKFLLLFSRGVVPKEKGITTSATGHIRGFQNGIQTKSPYSDIDCWSDQWRSTGFRFMVNVGFATRILKCRHLRKYMAIPDASREPIASTQFEVLWKLKAPSTPVLALSDSQTRPEIAKVFPDSWRDVVKDFLVGLDWVSRRIIGLISADT